jgi:hypothetical protein
MENDHWINLGFSDMGLDRTGYDGIGWNQVTLYGVKM